MGETASAIAKKIGISKPAVSLSVERGERILKEMGLSLQFASTFELIDVPQEGRCAFRVRLS